MAVQAQLLLRTSRRTQCPTRYKLRGSSCNVTNATSTLIVNQVIATVREHERLSRPTSLY